MADIPCDVDTFAASLGSILQGVYDDLDGKLPDAVRSAAKVGRKETRKNAAASIKSHSGKYIKGWTYKVRRDGDGQVTGEVGNSIVPGLPHLLEKGHAKVGGGRVAGREHIAPAADDAFDELERAIEEAIESL